LALIFLLNRPGVSLVYESFLVVVLALAVRFLALGWWAVAAARQAVDRDLVDLARLMSASNWWRWRVVYWPLLAPSFLAAGLAIYLLGLWDVETLILIVPPGGETLALRIFNLLHYGHNPHVNALCLMLLAVAVLPLASFGLVRHGLARLR
jgi:iron(III) transport system permease protein